MRYEFQTDTATNLSVNTIGYPDNAFLTLLVNSNIIRTNLLVDANTSGTLVLTNTFQVDTPAIVKALSVGTNGLVISSTNIWGQGFFVGGGGDTNYNVSAVPNHLRLVSYGAIQMGVTSDQGGGPVLAYTNVLSADNSGVQVNGIIATNNVNVITNAFTGPTNTINLTYGSQLYVASGNCAVTNITGTISGLPMISSLVISNSSASSITLYTTIPSARPVGSGTTATLTILAAKVGELTVKNVAGKFTQYVTAAEQ
jgi:hypothetical protein